MYFVEMKGDKKVSLAEIKALCRSCGSRIIKRYDDVVVINKALDFSRLTASRSAAQILTERELKTKDFGEFKVLGPRKHEIELGGRVKGTVNVHNPENIIHVLPVNKKADNPLIGLRMWEFSQKDYGRLLPPYHLFMKRPLARLLINLSGARRGDTLLDPFCGSGSLLIEAELCGIHTVGSDISNDMIKKCKENCGKVGVLPEIVHGDVKDLYFEKKFDVVATDFPYGRGSGLYGRDKHTLYGIALEKINEFLKPGKYAAVMADEPVRSKKLRLMESLEMRVHKNMRRNIMVFQKKPVGKSL